LAALGRFHPKTNLYVEASKTISLTMSDKKYHQCKWIEHKNNSGDASVKVSFIDDRWIFVRERFASAKHVEDGEAQYVGELLFTSQIPINFCPYCGIQLANNPNISRLSVSHKQHWTNTRWEAEYFYQCSALDKYNEKLREFGSSTDKNGLWFVTKDNYDGYDVWFLERHIFATEQMVQNSEAEEVGEICFQYGFDIMFCPFCGEQLDEKRSGEVLE
jgi:hypothetical protein